MRNLYQKLIVGFFLLGWLNLFTIPLVSLVGELVIGVLFVGVSAIFINRHSRLPYSPFLVLATLACLLSISFGYVYWEYGYYMSLDVKHGFMLLWFPVFVLGILSLNQREDTILVYEFGVKAALVKVVFASFLSVLFYFTNLNSNERFINPNGLGVLLMTLLPFVFVWVVRAGGWRRWLAGSVFLCGFVGLYFTGARASILAIVVFLSAYSFFRYLGRSYIVFAAIYVVFVSSLVCFSYVYADLDRLVDTSIVQEISQEYTGKSMFTGRQKVWPYSWFMIGEKPFIGYGTPAQIKRLALHIGSEHNLYIRILLQRGFLGLSLFVLWMLAIFKVMYKIKDPKMRALICSGALALATLQGFEVVFIQGNMTNGVYFALLFGFGSAIIQVEGRCPLIRMLRA